MQKRRHIPNISIVPWLATAALMALLTTSSGSHDGSASSYAQALAKKITLPDQHFNITVGEHPDELTYRFNLTNGRLHTELAPTVLNCQQKPNHETMCRVSMVGWQARYTGSVTNDSDATDYFNVTATIKPYTHPPNPAQLGVSLSGARVKVTYVTDFVIDVLTEPPFTELHVFPNESVAKEVQEKFGSQLWDTTKPDVKKVLLQQHA